MTKDEFEKIKQSKDFIFSVDDEETVIKKVDHIRTMGKLSKTPDNYLVKRYYIVSKTTKVLVINQLAGGSTFVEEITAKEDKDWRIAKGEQLDFELADDKAVTIDPDDIVKMINKDIRDERNMSEDYILVIKGSERSEPTYGYMYLESEAERFCDTPGADYHYEKVYALDPDANYEIKEERNDRVYLVFEEKANGDLVDIGYTPNEDEAKEYLRNHSSKNLYTEEVVYLCPNDYGNMTEFLNKMIEEYEDGE